MRKRVLFVLVSILAIACMTICFVGCKNEEPELQENGPGMYVPADPDAEDPVIEEEPEENPYGFKFLLKDDGTYAVEVGEARLLSELQIPDTFKDKQVTEITAHGFENSQNLKKIVLPANIKIIGEEAFSGCYALEEVTVNGTASTAWVMSDGTSEVEVIGDLADWLVFTRDKAYSFTRVA